MVNSYLKGIPVQITPGNFFHTIRASVELIIDAFNCGGYFGTKKNKES